METNWDGTIVKTNCYGMIVNPSDPFGWIVENELSAGEHDVFRQHRLLSFLELNRNKLERPPIDCLQRMDAEGIISVGQLWNCLSPYVEWEQHTMGTYKEVQAQEQAHELIDKLKIKRFYAIPFLRQLNAELTT